MASSFSSTAFRNVVFVPSNLRNDLHKYAVEKVFAVGDKPTRLEMQKPTKTNHWYLLLQIGSEQAIEINMLPTDNIGKVDKKGFQGVLLIGLRDFAIPKDAAKYVEVKLQSSHRFKDFLDVLIEKGYQNYDFNELGAGCHYFVKKSIELLESKKLIEGASSALNVMDKVWKNGEEIGGKAPTIGTFH